MLKIQRDRRKTTKLVIIPVWLILFVYASYLLWSNYSSNQYYQPVQDTEFSHKVHSGEFGIKCISCHSMAEKGQMASLPSVDDCMSCHVMLKYDSEKLINIVDSYENDIWTNWTKVYSTPDYVQYDHSVHIKAGIDCATCHSEVEKLETMNISIKHEMKWCVDCHNDATKFLITPRDISGIYIDPNKYKHNNLDSVIKEKINKGKISCSYCHH